MSKDSSKSNTDSFTAPFASYLLSSVMSQQSNILKRVYTNEPALRSGMKFAMDELLGRSEGKRQGKFQHVEKLVNFGPFLSRLML